MDIIVRIYDRFHRFDCLLDGGCFCFGNLHQDWEIPFVIRVQLYSYDLDLFEDDIETGYENRKHHQKFSVDDILSFADLEYNLKYFVKSENNHLMKVNNTHQYSMFFESPLRILQSNSYHLDRQHIHAFDFCTISNKYEINIFVLQDKTDNCKVF